MSEQNPTQFKPGQSGNPAWQILINLSGAQAGRSPPSSQRFMALYAAASCSGVVLAFRASQAAFAYAGADRGGWPNMPRLQRRRQIIRASRRR